MGASTSQKPECRGKSGSIKSAYRRMLRKLAVVAGTILLSSIPAHAAESLRSALSHAYRTNPQLQAERFRQNATDERLPQAQAGWRPTVEASTSIGYQQENGSSVANAESDPLSFKIKLRQPVFSGFRTQNSVAQANQVIAAGRQELLLIEQEVLLNAVTAYMNVLRDRDVVRLRHNQVGILRKELSAARGRFELGAVTRTDVAQALARFQSAIASHDHAKANLGATVGEFLRYVGRAPGSLKRPRLPHKMPLNLHEAVRLAEQYNPEIKMAMHNEVAARHFVNVRRGALLPQIALEAEYDYNATVSTSHTGTETAIVRGVLTVPLYQSGTAYSNLREAKQQANRRRMLILNARRKIRSQMIRVWNRYIEASQKIKSVKSQTGAAIQAVEGVRREALLGTRTTQDILDAERDLMNARIALAAARRDRIVRAHEVIATAGRLTARTLALDVALHDPRIYHDSVDGRWFGASVKTQ